MPLRNKKGERPAPIAFSPSDDEDVRKPISSLSFHEQQDLKYSNKAQAERETKQAALQKLCEDRANRASRAELEEGEIRVDTGSKSEIVEDIGSEEKSELETDDGYDTTASERRERKARATRLRKREAMAQALLAGTSTRKTPKSSPVGIEPPAEVKPADAAPKPITTEPKAAATALPDASLADDKSVAKESNVDSKDIAGVREKRMIAAATGTTRLLKRSRPLPPVAASPARDVLSTIAPSGSKITGKGRLTLSPTKCSPDSGTLPAAAPIGPKAPTKNALKPHRGTASTAHDILPTSSTSKRRRASTLTPRRSDVPDLVDTTLQPPGKRLKTSKPVAAHRPIAAVEQRDRPYQPADTAARTSPKEGAARSPSASMSTVATNKAHKSGRAAGTRSGPVSRRSGHRVEKRTDASVAKAVRKRNELRPAKAPITGMNKHDDTKGKKKDETQSSVERPAAPSRRYVLSSPKKRKQETRV